MKVGKFMMPLHPPEKDRTQTFEEDAECIDRQRQDDAGVGVDQAEFKGDDEERDEQDLEGHHGCRQYAVEDGLSAAEMHPGQSVAGQRAEEQIEQDSGDGDVEGIEDIAPEGQNIPGFDEVAPDNGVRYPMWWVGKKIG